MNLLDLVSTGDTDQPDEWLVSTFTDLEFAFFVSQPSEMTEFYGWSSKDLKVGDILVIPPGRYGRGEAGRMKITYFRRPGETTPANLYFGHGIYE